MLNKKFLIMKKLQIVFISVSFLFIFCTLFYLVHKYTATTKPVTVSINNPSQTIPTNYPSPTLPPMENSPRTFKYTHNGVTVSISEADVIGDTHSVPVYITQAGKKRVLIKDVSSLDGIPNFSTTTNPDLIMLRTGYGDGPGGFTQDYYITLSSAQVLSTFSSYMDDGYSSGSITDTFGMKEEFSELVDTSKCGTSTPISQHRALLEGVQVNNAPGYIFTPPIILQCYADNPANDLEYGEFYAAVKILGFNHDLTNAYFSFTPSSESTQVYYFVFDLVTKKLEQINKIPVAVVTVGS
jgi:hypothetical protein